MNKTNPTFLVWEVQTQFCSRFLAVLSTEHSSLSSNTDIFSLLYYLIWCSYICFFFTLLHWLQRHSVIDKTQAKRTTAGSSSAQKVQSRHSMRWCKIMSLVTKKAQLRTNKVTSVIMHEKPIWEKLKLRSLKQVFSWQQWQTKNIHWKFFVSSNIYCTEERRA